MALNNNLDMKAFIDLYFRQKHFNGMPSAVRNQFNEYIEANDFRTKDMKKWRDELMHLAPDPQNPNNQIYVQNNLPDANMLDDAEWEEIYKALRNVFRSMDENRSSFADQEDVVKFLDEYFGKNKMFSAQVFDSQTQKDIKDVLELVDNESDIKDLLQLSWYESQQLDDLLKDRNNLDSNKLAGKDTKELIFNIVSKLSYQETNNQSDEIKNKLGKLKLDEIKRGLQSDNIDPSKLNDLKANFSKIFDTLHDKNKIYKVFSANDTKHEISSIIDSAIKKTDYTSEENYVPKKYQDKLDMPQKIQKKLKDTYKDVLKKYIEMRPDHIYMKEHAKTIMGAFDDADIKPTDGIAAVLDKANKISGAIKDKHPFDAGKHFQWFVDTMTVYQKAMPKAFEKALKNGEQMNHIVEQLIIDAVDSGKIEEAKTAMEMLTAMQYSLFTSKTMDAINQTDMTIFGDKAYSFNNNKAVQTVMNGVDWALKKGIQAVGYGITAAVNTYRKRGATFNRNASANKLIADEQAKIDAERVDFANSVNTSNTKDTAEIQRLNGVKNDPYFANKLQNGLSKAEQDLKNTEQDLQKKSAEYNRSNELAVKFRQKESLEKKLQALDKVSIENELKQLKTDNQLDIAKSEPLKKQYADIQEIEKQIKEIDDWYANEYQKNAQNKISMEDENKRLTTATNGQPSLLDKQKAEFETAQAAYNKLEGEITEFNDADDSIKELQSCIDKRNDALKNWDNEHKNQYLELMAYWDFQQTGNTKNMFRLSTKKLQQQMDKKNQNNGKSEMDNLFMQWRMKNGYQAA